MSIEVKIPALGESISSGILSSWKVANGSYVEIDQPIYELETDKITQEGLAEATGVITFLSEEGMKLRSARPSPELTIPQRNRRVMPPG